MQEQDGGKTLDKALDVLEAIGSAPQGLDYPMLARAVALPRTTLYRMLATLVQRGMIRRDRSRKVYRLGFRYLELVRHAYLMPDLVAAASFELRALRDLTGETSYLAVLDGNQVLSLERCDGGHSQRSAAVLGQNKPVYCTSQGKAILSVMEDDARNRTLTGVTMTALTPLTITDRRRLQAELKITAARGYAIDDEEIVLGIRCVGAPIVDAAGQVRGALSVAGPAFRLTLDRLALIGPEVAEAARRVGAQLAPAEARVADASVHPIAGQWAFNGAFPCLAQDTGQLYWADTLAPSVRLFDGRQDRLFCTVESPIVALLVRPEGLLLAHKTGWISIDMHGHATTLDDWPGSHLACMCAHPDSTLWGCLADGNDQWRVTPLQPGGEQGWTFDEPISALAWSKNGDHLYALATRTGTIYFMQPQQAQIRRFATLPKGAGKLSGLALDADGGVWTALRDGWSVVHFTVDGNLERLVGVPAPCPTDLVLSHDGKVLFVTTSREKFDAESLKNAPHSGQMFAIMID